MLREFSHMVVERQIQPSGWLFDFLKRAIPSELYPPQHRRGAVQLIDEDLLDGWKILATEKGAKAGTATFIVTVP